MTHTIIRSIVLVTVGALLAGHTLVSWARRQGDVGERAPALVIACGIVAAGLALQGDDDVSSGVLLGALALIVAGLLALARRRARTLSQ
jgi:MYXO-CTERM domain-containing protein